MQSNIFLLDLHSGLPFDRQHPHGQPILQLLLHGLLLDILQFRPDNPFPLHLLLTLKLVFIPKFIGLVKFRDPTVVLKEEINITKDIQIDDVLDCFLHLWNIALGDLIGSVHVGEANVEEDESAGKNC